MVSKRIICVCVCVCHTHIMHIMPSEHQQSKHPHEHPIDKLQHDALFACAILMLGGCMPCFRGRACAGCMRVVDADAWQALTRLGDLV